ncbi:MAG TPA: beta-ketoacyl-ACP synthase II [Vicinamibacterales bacterium]|nr:beta-ketoacyl-ACP synthase II [Vicinamibacterales bacterium]
MSDDRLVRRDPQTTRVVITGAGTINPIGNTVEEYWANLIAGKSGSRLARHTDLSNYPVKIAAEVDLPDVSAYFPRKAMLRRLDRFIVFSHIAISQVIVNSGLDPGAAPSRYGVILGTADAGVGVQLANIRNVVERGIDSISPFYVVGTIPNTAAGYSAKEFDLRGPNFTVNSACASGNHAIGVAAMTIKTGMADAVLTGGSEAVVNVMGFGGFGTIHALSERNDSPETASRPFDRDRDGFVLGEGAAVVCLEELEHAKRRGAHILCELTGWGFSCDAHDLVAPHPEGRGALAAMQMALDSAGLNPEDIDLINAHGTSTRLGDLSEARAIRRMFDPAVAVHSTKSLIGHLIGAAGGAEAIAAAFAIDQGVIHPTINQFERDPDIDLNIVSNEARAAEVEHVLSNSFGFGGQNATLVFSKFRG